MKNYLKISSSVSSKDKFNSASALNLKDFAEVTLPVIGGAIYETEENGEKKNCAFIVALEDDKRVIISTISKTAVDCIDALIDYMDEQDDQSVPVEVTVELKKSNGGRDYIMLSLA